MRAACIALLGFGIASAACGSRLVGGDTGPTDATHEAWWQPPNRTYTFVIDRLEIDPTDDPDVPHTGFDIDDLYSADIEPLGCTHQDFFSVFDPDQHCANVVDERCAASPNPGCARGAPGCRGGVDNQLPTLANTFLTATNADIRVSLSGSIARSESVILVRLTAVDDLTHDDHIRVAFYRGWPRFADGCDHVEAGREYSIDRASLVGDGTDIDAVARYSLDGSIVDGRVRVTPGSRSEAFDIPLDLNGHRSTLPVRSLEFRADVSGSSLDRASLGGWFLANEVIEATASAAPDYLAVMRAVLGGLVDIQVEGVCDGSGMTPPGYGGISVGFDVHAVPALISLTLPIADARGAGTCGAVTVDGGDGG